MDQDEKARVWEYEYDPTETEDFYFTFDVSTNRQVPAPKAGQANRKASKPIQKGSQRDEAVQGDNLQVLGLDSIDPLIMLDGDLYSCQWSTDLGTQFYVAKPGVVEQPLRSGYVLDVIGLSRVRLTGKPATLHERRNESEEQVQGARAENAIELDDDTHEDATERSRSLSRDLMDTEAAAIPAPRTPEITDAALQARASFLERLQSIKQRKGETDRVPLYGVKNYQTPANKQEIRQRAVEADMEKSANEPEPNGGFKTRSPYKRKSATAESSKSEKKGKKPGPKTNASIRASLGFTAVEDATPPLGSGLRSLRAASEAFAVADDLSRSAQVQHSGLSNDSNDVFESTTPQNQPTNTILDQT